MEPPPSPCLGGTAEGGAGRNPLKALGFGACQTGAVLGKDMRPINHVKCWLWYGRKMPACLNFIFHRELFGKSWMPRQLPFGGTAPCLLPEVAGAGLILPRQWENTAPPFIYGLTVVYPQENAPGLQQRHRPVQYHTRDGSCNPVRSHCLQYSKNILNLLGADGHGI